MNKSKPLVLIVLDGFGVAKPSRGNAVHLAKMPNYREWMKKFPHTLIECTGKHVGLPPGTQGNSEVGHLHMGAGKIVWQPMQLINNAIDSGKFYKNRVLLKAIENVKKHDSGLHLMGLCSDEGVHATTEHLFALLELAKKQKVKNVFIHCFLDGRDVPERSAGKFIKLIESKCRKIGIGKIASVVGRYYAMDRDTNWDRTQKAFELLTEGKGFKAGNALEAIEDAYKRGDKTDYYVQPTVIEEKGVPVSLIKGDDSVVFFNFRTDRARQLSKAFVDGKFSAFKRKKLGAFFVSMTEYDKNIKSHVAFYQEKAGKNLGKVLAEHGLKQLRIAETEKYAHVTFFFNSQVERPEKGEGRILVPSPKVPSYDLKPEMSAFGVSDRVVEAVKKKNYDFILVNFANPDLVAHSGNLKATIKALEVVDECLGKIISAVNEKNGIAIITADHGSAEEMLLKNGEPNPSHSKKDVALLIVSRNEEMKKLKLIKGETIDIPVTVLELMGIKKPKEMTGKSLIKH